MEENTTPDAGYIKGFNEGYIIAKYMPETANKLTDKVGDSSRSQGFQDGWKQFQNEKDMDIYPSWLTGKKDINKEDSPSKNKDKDKGMDKE